MAEQHYGSSARAHVVRVVVVLVAVAILAAVARGFFVPPSFGKYGHYRATAIRDEINRPIRNKTNDSCMGCHSDIKQIHLAGVHRTVACEVCHSAYADHVDEEGRVIARMPKRQGEEIRTLCLRCHNRIVRARPREAIRMIAMPAHLEEQKVRPDHICNQCHNVHSPLVWIQEARQAMGLPPKEEGRFPWMNE